LKRPSVRSVGPIIIEPTSSGAISRAAIRNNGMQMHFGSVTSYGTAIGTVLGQPVVVPGPRMAPKVSTITSWSASRATSHKVGQVRNQYIWQEPS
jgi:hypothetical protein